MSKEVTLQEILEDEDMVGAMARSLGTTDHTSAREQVAEVVVTTAESLANRDSGSVEDDSAQSGPDPHAE